MSESKAHDAVHKIYAFCVANKLAGYDSSVLLPNENNITYPLSSEIIFDDGSKITIIVDNANVK